MAAALFPQPKPEPKDDVLVLDAHTFKDLEVFESETGDSCLFDLCNLARTSGGMDVVRRRMENPWSSAPRIHSTQASINFIIERWPAFIKLPEYLTERVHRYSVDILPLVPQKNPIEFGVGAFLLRSNSSRHYFRIALGVHSGCGWIQALRQFLGQAELASPPGDLAPLFEEMRELLSRPRITRIPDREIKNWVWKVLRLDQIFRVFEQDTIARLLQIVYEIDALVALAEATRKQGFVMPVIEEGPQSVYAENLVHPYVENAVANPVNLDQEHRVLFLTGPNMAGKTTYLRAFATALYLAHLGMGVPASSFRFVPVERLFSSISLSDDLHNGISYFRAEALRVKAVAEAIAAGYRVTALMDEPFKGTNFDDAIEASLTFLKSFSEQENCLFMFSSHLIELREELRTIDRIECCCFEADEGEGRLRFNYLLRPGVSKQRLGMRVLREEGVFELLQVKEAKQSDISIPA